MNEMAAGNVFGNRALSKASQVLTGIVTGIVADGHLHDMEVQMLSTWLASNDVVVNTWPGFAIARLVREVLADGIISEEERAHLLAQLQALVGNDFSETGAVDTAVAELPFDDNSVLKLMGSRICLTGSFLYGTRDACERIAIKAGSLPASNVSKKVDLLIVGTHIAPDWVNTSYGTKIIRAMELRDEGHRIAIVRERRWIELINAVA